MKGGHRIALSECVFIFLLVSLSCIGGILSRDGGNLAWIWPANAILLAVFVRFPHLAHPAGWLTASLAYLAADYATGSPWLTNVLLNLSNLSGVAVGYWLYMRYPPEIRLLQRPNSAILLVGASITAGLVTSVLGMAATVLLFEKTQSSAFGNWLSSELTSYLALMPFVLTLPEHGTLRGKDGRFAVFRMTQKTWINLGIWMLFLGSCALGVVMGGPGAIMLPVPALLLMALTFPLFATASIVLAYVLWSQAAMSMGIIDVGVDGNDVKSVISLRLGLTLMALGPLAVATTNAGRNKLLLELQRLASYDSLTGVPNRAAFMQQGEALISRASVVLLLMDIDHFKSINDRFGHHVGDAVLVAFCNAISRDLPPADVFGRLGGEEFALLSCSVARQDALALAQGLCRKIEKAVIAVDGLTPLNITVSIGVVTASPADQQNLAALLKQADALLYRAKAQGRNRAVLEG